MAESADIILFPDYQKLREEVDKLRIEISMLVLEKDELEYSECRNIEMEYMLTFGSLEYQVYEARCEALRLKRKIDIIQARLNRQEEIGIRQIEETLDREFADYQKKLDEQIGKMNSAIKRSRLRALAETESKELKGLYRRIVKRLHPDLNPDITEAEIRLFDNAVAAFKDGDLQTLRIIESMIGGADLPDSQQDSMSVLREEKDRMIGIISYLKSRIAEIKADYPYTLREYLTDEEKGDAYRKELEDSLREYGKLKAVYTEKIEEMMRR